MLIDGYDFVIDLDRSSGNRFHDSRSGRDILDFFSCFSSLALGWNHPEVKAVEAELGRVAVNNISNSDLYTKEMAESVDTICRVALPDDMPNFFMVAGGALAVENSFKVAMDWKMHDRQAKGLVDSVSCVNSADAGFCWTEERKESEKVTVGHFREAFHGRSGYTMSVTNTDPAKTNNYPKFDWPRFHNPKIRFPLDAAENARLDEAENICIESIRAHAAENPDTMSAVIIEPMQGEGGDNHFRDSFMRRLCDVTHEVDAMFIVDEVQTGLGSTGKMWMYEHSGIKPDILAFGKKMQVCGIMASDTVKEFDDNPFDTSSRINSTWGGNLIDMVRSAKQLEVIERDRLVENAALRGEELLSGLNELGDSFEMISNVRGRGLMAAFSLPDMETRDRIRNLILEGGAHVLNSGLDSIRLRPSLILSSEEIDEALNIFQTAAKRLEGEAKISA